MKASRSLSLFVIFLRKAADRVDENFFDVKMQIVMQAVVMPIIPTIKPI